MHSVEELRDIQQQARLELDQVRSPEQLEAWRVKYLGTKGLLKGVMDWLKDIPTQDKRQFGQAANALKQNLKQAYQQRSDELQKSSAGLAPAIPSQDITLPGRRISLGHAHIVTQTINELCEIFARMGFEVAYGPEVEDEHHNFDALNIPPSHVARDERENFYISPKAMLRSQTSTVQIRVMETRKPPIRIIAPGRVYRPDTVDATHSFMFYQLEGLYVDEGVTMSDLKTCIDQFAKAYFGHEVATRFRPSFFPFTEPSAEVDLLFHYDDGPSRWIELGGCGMVDPNVLEAVGYDSGIYTGFAFGLGIERMIMRRHNIPDIRLLYEGDVRFVRQF